MSVNPSQNRIYLIKRNEFYFISSVFVKKLMYSTSNLPYSLIYFQELAKYAASCSSVMWSDISAGAPPAPPPLKSTTSIALLRGTSSGTASSTVIKVSSGIRVPGTPPRCSMSCCRRSKVLVARDNHVLSRWSLASPYTSM